MLGACGSVTVGSTGLLSMCWCTGVSGSVTVGSTGLCPCVGVTGGSFAMRSIELCEAVRGRSYGNVSLGSLTVGVSVYRSFTVVRFGAWFWQ